MTNITVTIHDEAARKAVGNARSAIEFAVSQQLARGADEVAREAKRLAPKLYSTLASSIRAERVGALHYRVSTGMNYARAAEEGTGPAAGKARYYPNPESLMQYLRMSPSARGRLGRIMGPTRDGWNSAFSGDGKWGRKGSKRRGGQELELWFRSRAMAWAIYNKGTKAQPYMAPALEAKRSRLFDLVQQGVADGVRGVFG